MDKVFLVIEKLINLVTFFWIALAISAIGFILGVFIYANMTNDAGFMLGLIISLLGIIGGFKLVFWAKRNGGTTEFISRVNASPDINEAVREKEKEDKSED